MWPERRVPSDDPLRRRDSARRRNSRQQARRRRARNRRPSSITISGILSTGGAEDDQIVAPLALAQQILGKPGAVRRVYVSALTKPEDALAVRDPKTMTPEVYDRWYCSPYVQSIAYQLQEAIPHSHAEQIRQVAQNEGTVLSRIKGLMLLVTLAALFASALAVSAAMATAIFERRSRSWTDEGSGRRQFFRRRHLLRGSPAARADRRQSPASPPERCWPARSAAPSSIRRFRLSPCSFPSSWPSRFS